MKTRWWIGVWLVLALAVGTWVPAVAQDSTEEYFPETGHIVKGEFLRYYKNAPDARELFGFPISEAFTNNEGREVQYFQRARFEFHPEQAEGQRVQLTPIGRETYVAGPQLNIDNPFVCQTFGSNIPVCYAFLDFYLSHGGVARFGQPISPFEYRDNLIVQTFENARFEWKPWLPEGKRVSVADLGKVYFYKVGEDPNRLKPVVYGPIGSRPVLSLQARAFAWKAVTLANDQQLIFVVVQDQTLLPVEGAVGTATIRWPNGAVDTLPLASNSNGIGIIPLSVVNQPYGNLVYVDISVTIGDHTATTTTSFRIWY